MADYNTLTLKQKIEGAMPGSLAYYNVKNPPTTLQDRDNLNRGIGEINASVQFIKELGQSIGLNTPININEFPELNSELSRYIPSGYTVSIITLREIIDVANGVKQNFEQLSKNTAGPQINSGVQPSTLESPAQKKKNPSISDTFKEAAATTAAAIAVAAVANVISKPKKTAETVNLNPAQTEITNIATNPSATGNNNTVPGIKKAQSQAALKDTTNFEAKKDWRVRLSLSPGANYLYKAQNPGILAPLLVTDGVLFPYTPSIQVNYNASYDGTQLTHSNYKFFQYTSSNVDSVNLTCDFTAQDTYEANYLLAVIHFFRSATKMFYGQDENPKPGTPPPLCYLFGLGEYQFNAHPLAITSFSYSLPNNVDYIRANLNESGSSNFSPTARRSNAPTKAPEKPKILDVVLGAVQQTRLVQGIAKLGNVIGVDLIPGGGLSNSSSQNNKGFNSIVPPGTNEPTYVPTSIQLSISCVPIVSRYDISNTFSLRDYATGELLRGVKRSGGGIW